jgi:iron(III) transport system substrate-binding protein
VVAASVHGIAWCLALLTGAAWAAAPARSLVVYCSHDPDACELAADTFERETGIATSIARKPTGEFYAQLRAERDNPKADVWYGGTIDPFLQGAAEGLFDVYRSPRVAELHPWAQSETAWTGYRVGAIYRIVLAFGGNPAILANRTRNLIVPAHAKAEVRPQAERFAIVRTVNVDPARFGAPAERQRLLARWQKEIGDARR